MTEPAIPLTGVIPPLVTPFTEDGRLDVKSLQRHAETAAAAGAPAVWLNGTTAEFHALSGDERTTAVREVAAALQGTPCAVIAHVGAPGTRLAVRLAEGAVAAGAHAVSAVLPYYLPYEQDEIKSYYRAIHRAAGRPVFVYQVPMMTKLLASAPTILELAAEGTVFGLKDSHGDATTLRYLLAQARAEGIRLPTFVGDSMLMDTAILAGGAGAITAVAVVVPRHCQRVVDAALAGDFATARRLQDQLVELLTALRLPKRAPGTPRISPLKFLLAELGVIATPTCAEPFRPLDSEEQEALRRTALPVIERLESAA